jgi:hypothetical protein
MARIKYKINEIARKTLVLWKWFDCSSSTSLSCDRVIHNKHAFFSKLKASSHMLN